MGTYKVKLVRGMRESKETEYLYVSAPDTKSGYDKAAKKALAKLQKKKGQGFIVTAVNAVG